MIVWGGERFHLVKQEEIDRGGSFFFPLGYEVCH